MMDNKAHWSQIYDTKDSHQVSWYQDQPHLSLEFIQQTDVAKTGQIIDVGGGASSLVDYLLEAGYQHVTVLDISVQALHIVRRRLAAKSEAVTLIEADITQVELPQHFFDVWHDRAVFHFLTQPEARERYLEVVKQSVKVGGHIIVATFALDGPDRCSGLEVMRYNPDNLKQAFGSAFELVESRSETHHTPFGTEQKFIYCYCRMHE